MATPLPPPGPPMGPPPGPGMGAPPGPGASPMPEDAPMMGGPEAGGGPEQIMQGILGIAAQIEQMLNTFAQAMPNGAKLFAEANDMIKQGIAAEMEAAQGASPSPGAGAPAVSPTEAGAQFPGGGFGSGARP